MFIIALLLLLCGCATRQQISQEPALVSIQTMDRNGFSETVSNKDRLEVFSNVDFLSPQSYQKVLRVYTRDQEGRSHSKLTSYHDNGEVWQFLEILEGRAHGKYQEWFPSGKLHISATVIDGTADLSPLAQKSWLFDGQSQVFDERENLIAQFHYEKGVLEGQSTRYHPNGQIAQQEPYEKGHLHGQLLAFSSDGLELEKTHFSEGKKHGLSTLYWPNATVCSSEAYDKGKLLTASYIDPTGKEIASVKAGEGKKAEFHQEVLYSLTTITHGLEEGLVQIYSPEGRLACSYHILNTMKEGEELEYFPSQNPKLLISWHEDSIQGICKTWYPSGARESEKEWDNNKKNGKSFAWYETGELMLIEEYEKDLLVSGTYYKKGEKEPLSKVEAGTGLATLFDKRGHLIKKIPYEKGAPL